MSYPFHIDITQYSIRARWFMAIAWLIILAKCVLVSWAINHWQVPFNAAWIVGPTIAFAALASGIWLTHQRE